MTVRLYRKHLGTEIPIAELNQPCGKGVLYLHWSSKGKRYRMATGLPDTKQGRKAAIATAHQIESDLILQRFDPTLERYGKEKERQKDTPRTCVELFEKFIEYKRANVHSNTLIKYRGLLERLKVHPIGNLEPDNCFELSESFFKSLNELQPQTIKERLEMLRACWNWGYKKGLLKNANPWDDFKVGKTQQKLPPDPFTLEEVEKILNQFRDNHYLPYVLFLLITGCRTSEAIGLRWSDVDLKKGIIAIASSLRQGERKATKNYKSREIPINQQLLELLLEIPVKNELVFLSPEGKPINDKNFSQRIWRKALSRANVPYRKPYNCRHTFVSHCLHKGMPPIAIARLTGHRVEELYRSYANIIEKLEIPKLY